MVLTVFQYLFVASYRYDVSLDKSSIFDAKLRQKYSETYVKRTPSGNALVSA